VLRSRIEDIGTKFHPLPAGADFDLRVIDTEVPELKDIPPGPEWLRVAMGRVFVDAVRAQHEDLLQVMRNFATDIIIGDEDIFDRSIDVQVLRLRRKLEVDPSAPRVIRTERGVGYTFALPVEPFYRDKNATPRDYNCNPIVRASNTRVTGDHQSLLASSRRISCCGNADPFHCPH
jgi:hypothetical protein